MSKEIIDALEAIADEKAIPVDTLMSALEAALLSAYKKDPDSVEYARVEVDRESGDFIVWQLMIPSDILSQVLTVPEETDQPLIDPETGEAREPAAPELDFDKVDEFGDKIGTHNVTPENFGRIAAVTAKQVLLQRVREAERELTFDEYKDRVGELINGVIQQTDSRYTLVRLTETTEALLPRSEQVEGERYDNAQRIKAIIKEVSSSPKGPSIIVSRRDPNLIKELFELEVPEMADGLVEITDVAREPGYRSKIAVISHADGVDPVGACVGPRGSRVRMVVSELRGEKIDIIPFNDEPARFVAKALSPARVREVLVDDEEKQATVIVPDDQLALAIGRSGQNARLAARLTGWRIDIKSESDYAQDAVDGGSTAGGEEQEDTQVRCAAVLSNGRRCPNAPIEGSRYCGLEAHQEYERMGGQPPVEAPEPEPEAEADVEADASEAPVVEAVVEPAEAEAEEAVESAEAEAEEAAATEPETDDSDVEEPAEEAAEQADSEPDLESDTEA